MTGSNTLCGLELENASFVREDVEFVELRKSAVGDGNGEFQWAAKRLAVKNEGVASISLTGIWLRGQSMLARSVLSRSRRRQLKIEMLSKKKARGVFPSLERLQKVYRRKSDYSRGRIAPVKPL